MGVPGQTLSVLFSLVAGAAASILSLLTLEVLRRSPFGRAVFMLSLVMVIFVVYHAAVLLTPERGVLAEAVKSVMFTGIAGFVWLTVWSQYRMRRRAAAR